MLAIVDYQMGNLRGVQAASNLKSIHLSLQMRTLPGDNFGMLDLGGDFVNIQLWKQFDPLRWKVAKPGRVAAMNGKQTVLLIGGGNQFYGMKVDTPAASAFDTDWLHRLAAVDKVLATELAAITASGYDVKTEHALSSDGTPKDVITVDVNTNDKVGAYLKNKFLDSSDTRRVYTFDPQTNQLENVKYYCRDHGAEVLVLELTEIDYDPPIDESFFTLKIPENIVWYQPPQQLADNEKYEKMTPAEAARAIFEAMAKRNWDEVAKFFPMALTDDFKKAFGGLEILSIGEPFQSNPYDGWFVPYEIRRSRGDVAKHNLALRKDATVHRFFVDGGLP